MSEYSVLFMTVMIAAVVIGVGIGALLHIVGVPQPYGVEGIILVVAISCYNELRVAHNSKNQAPSSREGEFGSLAIMAMSRALLLALLLVSATVAFWR